MKNAPDHMKSRRLPLNMKYHDDDDDDGMDRRDINVVHSKRNNSVAFLGSISN